MENEPPFLNQFFARSLLDEVGGGSDEAICFLSELMKSARKGDLCLKKDEEISLPGTLVEEGKTLFPKAPVVRDENRYYLQKNWVYETYLIEQIKRLKTRSAPSFYDEAVFLKRAEEEKGLLAEQRDAILHSFRNPFSIISGGPGTGKTYTAGQFIRILLTSLNRKNKQKYRIVLAAPTGKAALHLKASLFSSGELDDFVECEATTLHRLLGLRPGETKLFSGKTIDADLIVVDESSMIDISLLAHLLEGVGEETLLVLLGDPDQLPPVDSSSLFAECAELFGVSLKRCMRTESSNLQIAAEAIRCGDEEGFFKSTPLSYEFNTLLIDRLYQKISPLILWENPDPFLCIEHYQKCRILNALRQGPLGAEEINRKILARMEALCEDGQWWAVPILVTANLPKLNLFNGSLGVLIGKKTGRIILSEGVGYFFEIEPNGVRRLPPFELSFCLSVHKSQGSEFKEVIALFPQGSENFGRECLYTAATRAKLSWEAVGAQETFRKMLSQRFHRVSGFKSRVF